MLALPTLMNKWTTGGWGETNKTGYLSLSSVDSDNNLLSGVTFGIYSDEDCTEAVSDLVTIENENAVVELKVGTYYVKVVDVPEKYRLDSAVYTVEVNENETYELIAHIELATGYLSLKSVDDDGNSLSGVTFGIYSDEDCTEMVCDPVPIEDEAVVVELEVGTYYVKVVGAPSRCVLSDNVYSVDIVEDDTVELNVEIEIFKLKRTDFTPSDLTEMFATEIDEYYDGNVWSLVTDKLNVDNIVVGDWVPTDVPDEDGTIYTYDMEIACINCYEGECYDNDNPVYDGSGDGAVTKVPSHIDIISEQLFNTSCAWHSSGNNNNGSADQQCPWLHSDLYAYLQDTVFSLLPQQLQDVAIEKCMLIEQRYSSSGTVTSPTGECWQPIGKLWIPNEVEIFGSASYSSTTYGNYGVQYTTFNSATKRKRYRHSDSSANYWWSLSPRSNVSNTVVRVNTTGALSYNYTSNSSYFLLCLRLEIK